MRAVNNQDTGYIKDTILSFNAFFGTPPSPDSFDHKVAGDTRLPDSASGGLPWMLGGLE